MKGELYIYGCGGHAKSIINTALDTYTKKEIIVIDPNLNEEENILECKSLRQNLSWKDKNFIVGIGDNKARSIIYKLLCEKMAIPTSIIATSADIGINSSIGMSTFIANNVYLGPETNIGNNTIVNTGAIIEHETKIGNNTHIAPGAVVCGRCEIGDGCFVGAGAIVKDKIKICDNVVIGSGAVVIDNINFCGVYIGVPAIKKR